MKHIGSNENNSNWCGSVAIVLLVTIATRYYKVTEPDHVCWDETHFGKMASWYINRTFFFDVHPPLGKMLIGLSGYLTGYNGTFAFDKPGDKYENTSYIGMRLFCTTLGATLVPSSFLIVHEMTRSIRAAFFAFLLIVFDVGLITLTQYILLDPILLCFVINSTLGAVKVSSDRTGEFTLVWWMWLMFTGTMLACAICVKFVGLFVVLFVGAFTAADLWTILGDISRSVGDTVKHLVARGIFLIVWPICLYVLFFYIHLRVLNKSGNGDGFYSSSFQSQLIGNSLHNVSMPLKVAYGAIITIKNQRTGGGYLHSHYHLYPENVGARQQQITTYTHKDDNNKWFIRHYNANKNSERTIIVRNGDLIRLEHLTTGRNLHSHKESAPITKKHLQVTGYGENGTGDANDIWRLLIVGEPNDAELMTVTSKLRFVHYLQSCVLTTTGKQLPKWAYEQQEVTCNSNIRDSYAFWNIEENIYEKLPNVSFQVHGPSFMERFIESHAVMVQGNAGLKPKEGEVTSRPWQWPINYRGQFFSGGTHKIYLLGNPVIWFANLLFLPIYLLVFLGTTIMSERGYGGKFSENFKRKLKACNWLFLGWMLHYVPFWGMGRVLYFHHYFPALLFNSMLTAIILDNFLEGLSTIFSAKICAVVYHTLMALILSSTMYSFYLFHPLAYGMNTTSANEPNSTMYGLRWLDTWEF